MTASEESKVLAMDIQFDDGIKSGRFPILSWLTSRQAFWVLLAVCLACVFLSFATNSFAASNNIVVFQFGPDHDKLLFLGGGALLFGIANPVIYMLVLALLTGFLLRFTRFGRYAFAIGGNEHAAIVTGVPVRRTKIIVYMISALSAGIAGVIETGWLGAVTPNLGNGMELQVIAATVIGGANLAGGIGTAFGALIGSALIEVIRNSLGLLGISAFWQGTFVGSFIIVAVAFDRIRNFRSPT